MESDKTGDQEGSSRHRNILQKVLACDNEKKCKEYMWDRITNFGVAAFLGVFAAAFFRRLGDYDNGSLDFAEANAKAVVLTAGNVVFPGILIFIITALCWNSLRKAAEIVWDGAGFALYFYLTSVGVLVALMQYDGLEAWGDVKVLYAMVLVTIVSAFVIYTLLISLVMYLALYENNWLCRWTVGIVSIGYLAWMLVIKI